ncbi:hypothetical protein [Cellulomonas wangsupingiae]|uniref:O-antigen ligase domain-containing protein n=1 Tax=Cellulomonas wangsupingiae TaxID=2968085 RepID=A0ABY5K6E4_9CELL|nr:hypothetical protein [Cellulomonas wangsupingiae]MCC2334347.1 hypothetical protein [Cellulomonas wangsupingiae]UUI66019.1 hypothetical protein NP075_04620 [Cellulomonas wangsupingiae]
MISAGRVDDLAVMLVLLALAALFAVLVRTRPQIGLVAYIASIGLVPIWIGVQVGMFVGAATAVGIGVLVALLPGSRIRWTVWDGVLGFALAVVVVSWVGGYASLGDAYATTTGWLVPYLVGRVLVARLGSRAVAVCITLVFLVVAVLVVVEVVTGDNLFVRLAMGNPLYTQWSGIRMRGGLPRAEGAFGHAIPLGASLALVVPFVWSSRLPAWLRTITFVLIGVAAVVTYSRIGMLSTALALVLCVVGLGAWATRAFRAWAAVALVVGAALTTPTAMAVFAEAGDEASGSAEYRADLWSLLPSVGVLGRSTAAYSDASGTGGWGSFRSIDNAVLMTALSYGGFVAGLLVLLGVAALVGFVRGPRTPGLTAVVAILPSLTSVAFITQFSTFFWFVAGVAVAQTAAAGGADPPVEGDVEPARGVADHPRAVGVAP